MYSVAIQDSNIFWNLKVIVAFYIQENSDSAIDVEMQILSDSEKRSHYDRYLSSQRIRVQRCSQKFSMMNTYESNGKSVKQMEVVEWLNGIDMPYMTFCQRKE